MATACDAGSEEADMRRRWGSGGGREMWKGTKVVLDEWWADAVREQSARRFRIGEARHGERKARAADGSPVVALRCW